MYGVSSNQSATSLCEDLGQLLVWLTDIHKSIDKNRILRRNALLVARNVCLTRVKGVCLSELKQSQHSLDANQGTNETTIMALMDDLGLAMKREHIHSLHPAPL